MCGLPRKHGTVHTARGKLDYGEQEFMLVHQRCVLVLGERRSGDILGSYFENVMYGIHESGPRLQASSFMQVEGSRSIPHRTASSTVGSDV